MMMWTIEVTGRPDTAATLANAGATTASLRLGSLTADVLTLTGPLEAAGLRWPWGTRLTLRRGGEVFYHGKVARTTTDGSGGALMRTVEVRNVWWDLERLFAAQEIDELSQRPGRVIRQRVYSPRVVTGRDDDGKRVRLGESLRALMDYARSEGVPADLVVVGGPLYVPANNEAGQTVAGLVRHLLRWVPDGVCRAVYGDQGQTSLLVRAASVLVPASLPPEATALGGGWEHEQVVDGVHLCYETPVLQYRLVEDEDDAEAPATVVAEQEVMLFFDKAPAGSALTTRTLFAALPGEVSQVEGEFSPSVRGEVKWHRQPIRTRPIPKPGAYDSAAKRWWYDHMGLEDLGLKLTDMVMPDRTVGPVQAHTLSIPKEELDDPPSAVNPKSKPVYRTSEIKDYPRELVDGQIGDWMHCRATPMVASVTLALKKSAEDALPEAKRQMLLGHQPGQREIGGYPAYTLPARVTLTATNARTKVYAAPVAVTPFSEPAVSEIQMANEQARLEAEREAVIPGLAHSIYEARRTARWAGDVEISEAEAGAERWLGRLVSGLDLDGESWTGLVQAESLDLVEGTTNLTVGPPEHLAPQDWLALRDANELAVDQASRQLPAKPGPRWTASGDEGAPVVGGSVGPRHQAQWGAEAGASKPRMWQIRLSQQSGGRLGAEILTGTVSGVGRSGFLAGHEADQWISLQYPCSVWLRTTILISGIPKTYYIGPDETATIYVPGKLDSAEVVMEVLAANASPQGRMPTITPSGGQGQAGVFYHRIGIATKEQGVRNDLLGPLNVNYCAPGSVTVEGAGI